MSHPIRTARWWSAAGIRALKTLAQTAVALIGTSAIIADVPWPVVASGAALAALLSLLTSLAGLPELDAGIRVSPDDGHAEL